MFASVLKIGYNTFSMSRKERSPIIPREGDVPVSSKIRAVRWGLGMSVDELASMIGYSRSHLSHIETGSQPMSDELLLNIVDLFGMTKEEFDSLSRDRLNEYVLKRIRNGRVSQKQIPLKPINETDPSKQEPFNIQGELQEIKRIQNEILETLQREQIQHAPVDNRNDILIF